MAAVFLVALSTGVAQDSEKLSSKSVPDDAILAAFLSPSELMASSEWELMPTEVFRAAGQQFVGIDPMNLEQVTAVVGMPGPTGPRFGVRMQFSQDVKISDLNPQLLQQLEPGDEGGLAVYASRRPPQFVLHQADARTLMVAGGGYLKAVLEADGTGQGQLPALASKITSRSGVTVVAVLDQIRPLVNGLLQQSASKLPPPLQSVTQVGDLTDAVLVQMNYAPFSASATVSVLGRDDAAGEKLEQILNDAIDFGRATATAEFKKSAPGGGPVQDAWHSYIDRVSASLSDHIRPVRKGKMVRLDFSGATGTYATTGVLVGLLLPAVQAARQAARRVSASNSLKQIGLAMHNHYSAFQTLPDRAIRDADGKPLLSWRVKLLPFLEQQTLYEQFHLDEPWDSPHNIKLVDQMPAVYQHPAVVLPPGKTLFQVPVGEGLMFGPTGGRTFADVTDGLSNSVMVIESRPDAAVEWTKPDDLEIDLDDPLAQIIPNQRGQFIVLMGDGAVRQISQSIAVDVFQSLLTIQGRDPVNF
ncbi:DUF1559 family PulG-like putative transporter [Stieleria tagensis]|uniref:DUF1559 family PulG-like putative transporter n=1 Tax=Stieleria tagensis TaxID=2956795 RepID=UPI00209B444E|nr:DUF1559 domain-containing protein [Stieleria tagensis]